MHTVKMKKRKFIKNKVLKHIVKVNVEKATLILRTHATHGIDDYKKLAMHVWYGANNIQI